MAQMISTQFVSVVEPLLNEVFDGVYQGLPRQYTQIFKQETSIPRRFQEVGLGGAEA